MELQIIISLPEWLNSLDPLAVMEGVRSAIHLTPIIVDKARTVATGPHTYHEYSVGWFWGITEGELSKFSVYKDYFIRVREALEYFTKWVREVKALEEKASV